MAHKHDEFTIDPEIEACLQLRETDPEAWYALPAWQKILCACYEGSRSFAQSAGWPIIEPKGVPA